MPTYEVQAPDGTKYEATVPAGTSPAAVMDYVQKQHTAQPTQQQPAAAQQSPGDAAFAAGRQAGHDQSPLTAGISQAAQQATMGGQNYVNAASRYLAQRVAGITNPDDFQTDLAYSRGTSQGEAEAHKTASTIGGVAGGVLGAVSAGKALGAAAEAGDAFGTVARSILPVEGQSVRNVLKAAAMGGLQGGAQSEAQGQSNGEAGLAAAGGAVLSPVLGKAAQIVGSRYTGTASDEAWRTLAKAMNESPDTLQAARDAIHTATGDDSSVAQLAGLQSRGQLRALAAKNPDIAAAAMTAREANGVGFTPDARNASAAIIPQTPEGIRDLRDTVVSQAMSTPSTRGIPLRDTPVSDPAGLLDPAKTPHIDVALSPDQNLANRLRSASGIDQNGASTFDTEDSVAQLKDRLSSGTATIGDADRVRQALRNVQGTLMHDSPLSPKSPALANEFGDIANKVEGLATKADANYGTVTKGYRAFSDYADGMEHALKGNGQFDKTGSSFTDAALGREEGQRGWEHGSALRTRQEALDMISPNTVRPPEQQNAPLSAVKTVSNLASGGVGAVSHLLSMIPGTGRLPTNVQSVIARQAFDPATFPQAIANMRRAGVQEKDIANFTAALGHGAAGRAANSIVGQAP